MNSNIFSALHFAGDLLSDRSRRCQGTLAQNAKGKPVNPHAADACQWCLTGALCKACHELGLNKTAEQMEVYNLAKEKIGIPEGISLPVFWDDSSDLHDLVAGRLRKA